MTGTPVINPPKHVAGTGAPASEAAVVSLVEGIAKGDTAALGVFYEEWFDRAFDLTRTLTGRDESFCLDVVQDAMMKVIRKLRPALGITTRAALDAWFARVVHTTAIDQLRREARRRRRELGRTEPGAHAGAHASADELAHLDERIKWVAAEVRHLDSRETSMVVMRYGQDRSLESVGAEHGMTVGATHGRFRRLLERLRLAGKERFDE